MTTIGLIGAGRIGSTVARLAVDAGLEVALSNSRGPETLVDLVAELGDCARAGTSEEVAEEGDVVVVTIPLKSYRAVPVEPLRGKVVLDTNNYYPERDGHIAELDEGTLTSSGLLQRHLPESRVVKAFNTINFAALGALGRPAGSPERSALPIAGDDEGARKQVAELLDRLGYDAVDVGPLSASWRIQPGAPAYGTPYGGRGTATPAGAEVVRRLVDEA